MLYGLEAWGKIGKDEMNEVETIRRRALKRISNLPISTSYNCYRMETDTWPANQIMQYSTMMLYHNIMNSDHKRVAKKILAVKTKSNHKKTMISKMQLIAQEIGEKMKNVESMNKTKWKKQVKEKIGKSREGKTKQEMINKTTSRTLIEDKWERKKYLQKCDSDSDTIKDVIKIRLHMWQVNYNYKRNNTDTKCPLCKKSEDTTEHVLECEEAKKFTLSQEDSKREWKEIAEKNLCHLIIST